MPPTMLKDGFPGFMTGSRGEKCGSSHGHLRMQNCYLCGGAMISWMDICVRDVSKLQMQMVTHLCKTVLLIDRETYSVSVCSGVQWSPWMTAWLPFSLPMSSKGRTCIVVRSVKSKCRSLLLLAYWESTTVSLYGAQKCGLYNRKLHILYVTCFSSYCEKTFESKSK